MSNQELFARYEQLKMTIREAEKQIEELKPQITAIIPEGTEVEGEYGKFLVQSRATWKYSKDHETKKKELKDLEEEEKARGVATVAYSPVLYYNSNQDNE